MPELRRLHRRCSTTPSPVPATIVLSAWASASLRPSTPRAQGGLFGEPNLQPHPVAITQGLAKIVYGGGGAPTSILCGYLGNDLAYNALIALLPRSSAPPTALQETGSRARSSSLQGSLRPGGPTHR